MDYGVNFREFQRTSAKLNGEGQDFINSWPCSDVTAIYKNSCSVRTSAILFRN